MGGFIQKLTRRKLPKSEGSTQLRRCLTTLDLVALGVGTTLGAGVYILSGEVGRSKTGPSIIISFLVAAFSSVLAGLCYAEFGARVPKALSAYTYSYVTVGELWAFVIGWNLILEYVIATSSLARAWSSNLDTILNGALKEIGMTYLRVDVTGFADYPDFVAFAMIIILTVVLCFGVKISAMFTKIFTGINILVIAFVVIGGLFNADIKNWNLTEEDIDIHINEICYTQVNSSGTLTSMLRNHSAENEECHKEFYGNGGFAPHGFTGILKGAAVCFYGYIGFDVIASTGEEAINPKKAVPFSIILCLIIVTIAYFGVSCILTLMRPYYLLDQSAPLPKAFADVGWNWAGYLLAGGATCALSARLQSSLQRCWGELAQTRLWRVCAVSGWNWAGYLLAGGATCALSASLIGCMFPLPRVVYAMGQDGLIFTKLGQVSDKYKTPTIATLFSGILAGIMALIFDLSSLLDLISLGTLSPYTLVAACILILRYQPDANEDKDDDRSILARLFAPIERATKSSGAIVYGCTLLFCMVCIVLGCMLTKMSGTGIGRMTGIGVCSLTLLLLIFIIYRQPQNTTRYSFMVPFLPFLPIVSCFCNIYLMCELDGATWIRFLIWMLIGFFVYVGYGMQNSKADAPASVDIKKEKSEA